MALLVCGLAADAKPSDITNNVPQAMDAAERIFSFAKESSRCKNLRKYLEKAKRIIYVNEKKYEEMKKVRKTRKKNYDEAKKVQKTHCSISIG